MVPWIHLDSAPIPKGGGELRLFQRGAEFSIRIAGNGRPAGVELMNSRQFGSEEDLARLSCTGFATPSPVVLIGGLGMGFTLRVALGLLPAKAQVVVAELVPGVVAWARGPLAPMMAGCLDDPRVAIHEGDVAELIGASRRRFDAILLDVDNGPDGLTMAGNEALYGHAGLGAAKAALRHGGVLAIWSSGDDERFTRRLRDTGLAVDVHRVRARRGAGARHVIWTGRLRG